MDDLTRRGFLALTSAATVGAAAVAGAGCAGPLEGDPVIDGDRVTEPQRTIPVAARTDVLVLGGGPAGISAALAAAREGVATLLVERYGSFGGVITQNMMGSVGWYRYAKTVDAGGILLEFERKAREMGGTTNILETVSDTSMLPWLELLGLVKDGQATYELLKSELFKYVADVLLQEAKVTPLLHTTVVDAIMSGGAIQGVVVHSKSGRQAILAKRVIDATGDADVAAMAGAPFTKAERRELMECTANCGCTNVDTKAYADYQLQAQGKMIEWAPKADSKDANLPSTHIKKPFDEAIKAGELQLPQDVSVIAYPGYFTPQGEIPSLNMVHLTNVDPTDVWDLTRAEMTGRKLNLAALEVLRKRVPAFKDAILKNTAFSLGTRESRKIVGSYRLTEADVRGEARFSDSIGVCPEFLDGYGALCLPRSGRYFQVPYGVILPQAVENLLVAGRCVSGDRISHAATRQMVCCALTGQGAGVAAAESIRQGVTCRDVEIGKVQERLKLQGVRIA